MLFRRIEPSPELQNFIECYWIVEKEGTTITEEKIIPDGYTEIIFHYKEPYKIKIKKHWELQSKRLLAGQIRKHFFLQNTGAAGMVGIKFKPTALTHLFGLTMNTFTDTVVDLDPILGKTMTAINNDDFSKLTNDDIIASLDDFFKNFTRRKQPEFNHADKAIEMIFDKKGSVTIEQIIDTLKISERHLERMFKKYVGLPPKFYTRIIRFSYIFELIQKGKLNWNDLAFETGFYDQPHFIKNFKSFTGEYPTGYYFNAANMANFFLKKG